MRLRIYILFLLASLTLSLQAQKRVKLTGKVIDGDSEPIELATVRVAGTTMGTMTDLKGEYELLVPASDSITVIYSCLGYKEEQRTLINLEKDVSLLIRLNKKTRQLQEVVVSEYRKRPIPCK